MSTVQAKRRARYRHWRIEHDRQAIVWVYLERPKTTGARLGPAALGELEAVVAELSQHSELGGAVFGATETDGFDAGADLELMELLASDPTPLPKLMAWQALYDTIERLPFPTAAAIVGRCSGSALELALACDYRVAAESAAFGFPEQELGVHYGLGGSLRLPRLIGGIKALPLMLDSARIDAEQARRLGLVDYLTPRRRLAEAARHLLRQRPPRPALALPAQLSNLPLLRQAIAKRLRARSGGQHSAEHYPAPGALIDLWQRQIGDDATDRRAEAESLIALLHSEGSRNLLRLAGLRRRLTITAAARQLRHIHILGSGRMGAAIGAWCAQQGLKVTLQDSARRQTAAAIRRAAIGYRERLRPQSAAAALDRLQPDPQGHALPHADLVLEAVPEDIALKQRLLKWIEPRLKPGAIVASNTASIPIETLARALADPGRLVGIHFFNPVAERPLLELVAGRDSSAATLALARGFAAAIDRLALPIRSGPGFLIDRIHAAYLDEAMILLQEGVATTSIDATATRFGMEWGPLELADRIGLDMCLAIAAMLARQQGGEVRPILQELVAAGKLGRKSGYGFYEYRRGQPLHLAPEPDHTSLDEIGDRLIYRLLNEAVSCLGEGVVADMELLDVGMVLCGGFPAFRGGPCHYICCRGVHASQHRLTELAGYYGERFAPGPGWALLDNACAS